MIVAYIMNSRTCICLISSRIIHLHMTRLIVFLERRIRILSTNSRSIETRGRQLMKIALSLKIGKKESCQVSISRYTVQGIIVSTGVETWQIFSYMLLT